MCASMKAERAYEVMTSNRGLCIFQRVQAASVVCTSARVHSVRTCMPLCTGSMLLTGKAGSRLVGKAALGYDIIDARCIDAGQC